MDVKFACPCEILIRKFIGKKCSNSSSRVFAESATCCVFLSFKSPTAAVKNCLSSILKMHFVAQPKFLNLLKKIRLERKSVMGSAGEKNVEP